MKTMAEKKASVKKSASPKVAVKKATTKKASTKKAVAEEKAPAKSARSIASINKDNLLESLKRTLIPIGVGAVAASFIGPYVDQSVVRDFLSGVIAAVYYTVIRLAETKNPKVSVLLGSTSQPQYK